MAGFEREVKSRTLGFSPHLTFQQYEDGYYTPATDWREFSEKIIKDEEVTSAYGMIEDYIILDFEGRQVPGQFRAIDTESEEQIKELDNLVDKEKYGGDGLLGYDSEAIVSSEVSEQLGLIVGSEINLYSARNFQEVFKVYNAADREAASVEFAEVIELMRTDLQGSLRQTADADIINNDIRERIIGQMELFAEEDIRSVEKEKFAEMQLVLEAGVASGEQEWSLPLSSVEKIHSLFEELESIDLEEADNAALRDLKEVVLPRTVRVRGIYQSSKQTRSPALFIPLEIGQEMIGFDDEVQFIGVRIDDAYKANIASERLNAELKGKWISRTWMDDFGTFFALIKRERLMMRFVLSFVFLNAAFSFGAVMLTVTLQKRQEIGVMKALGATSWQIIRVFLYQGCFIGGMGGLLGTGLAFLVLAKRKAIQQALDAIGQNPFPADFHGMDVIPAQVIPSDVILMNVVAFLACAFAATVPAIIAARVDPAKSLRAL